MLLNNTHFVYYYYLQPHHKHKLSHNLLLCKSFNPLPFKPDPRQLLFYASTYTYHNFRAISYQFVNTRATWIHPSHNYINHSLLRSG